MIDIAGLFNYFDLPLTSSGKNVSKGWVQTHCPFPWCTNPTYHLGINLKTNLFHCWVCGEKGNLKKLLTQGFHIPYEQAKEAIKKFSDSVIYVPDHEDSEVQLRNIFPKESTAELPKPHQLYLLGRNFDPQEIQKKYLIRATYTTGKYAYRIIIPVIEDGFVVSFTSRDITNKQLLRYRAINDEDSVIPLKQCVYNIDNLKPESTVCISEGAFDVWRMGNGFISTMGTGFTTAQLALISRKKPKKLFVLFDSTALREANKIAWACSTFCSDIEILEIDKKDPAELTPAEASEIRKEIGL